MFIDSRDHYEKSRRFKEVYTGYKMGILYSEIIFAYASLADLSPSCSNLSVLLNFKKTSIRFYKYQ